MAYTREHLLVTYGTNNKVAFPVRVEGFRAPTTYPKQTGRNLAGALLQTHAPAKRAFMGSLILDGSHSGQTVEYDSVTYNIGQASHLLAMYSATNMQVKRHGDSAFWNAAVIGDFDPELLTPTASVQTALVQIVEK